MTIDKKTLDELFEEGAKQLETIANCQQRIETAKGEYDKIKEKINLAATPYMLEILADHMKQETRNPWMTYDEIKEELTKKDPRFMEIDLYPHLLDLVYPNDEVKMTYNTEGEDLYKLNEEKPEENKK